VKGDSPENGKENFTMASYGRGKRTEKLQLMLNDDELMAIDDWRFAHRLPTRAATIRELLRRGLNTEGLDAPRQLPTTHDYGVIG
jgi:hypothetical protein